VPHQAQSSKDWVTRKAARERPYNVAKSDLSGMNAASALSLSNRPL
jgi:hypothetical protein